MSWLQPSQYEQDLLEDTQERWPEIIPLARVLSLAQRVEPLFLRNARLGFVANAQAEIESQLWFSPLVGARSTSDFILHQGVARILANALRAHPQLLNEIWAFTRSHTQHWSPEDRLERDLRFHALMGEQHMIQQGLRDILKRIKEEQSEEKRLALARWAKKTLPVITVKSNAANEARLLAQYAGLALGTTGQWTTLSQPQSMPDWLVAKLPEPFDEALLAVEIRQDHLSGLVLHCVAPDHGGNIIPFTSPLPAQLHIAGEGEAGQWHAVTIDSRIKLPAPSQRIRLTTIDGRQYELETELTLKTDQQVDKQELEPVYLSHVEEDTKQAALIAEWLAQQGIKVRLLPDIEQESVSIQKTEAPIRLLRLWTRAAHRYWEGRPEREQQALARNLILRTEEVDPPTGVNPAEQLLDWFNWSQLGDRTADHTILKGIRQWLEQPEKEDSDLPDQNSFSPEIQSLIDEIDNPETAPPRRLKIGDRLAELGDPRPGVGVREIKVPHASLVTADVHQEDKPEDAERVYPPKVQRLLDEINNIKIKPPRRLKIGDELDHLDDPRKGVGLDEQGLPDIDWVMIPGGPFIYQGGEKVKLSTFYISRYPVTNAQFQAFIDASGYGEPDGVLKRVGRFFNQATTHKKDWWAKLKKPKPEKSRRPQGNRPRTDIDWYEAVAFTRWLTAQVGYEVRLPTEQEWEKVARGTKGLTYPWGNEYRSGYANIDETLSKAGEWNLGQTTAVGIYPQGQSPYGVMDMVGNIWEWCLNKYDHPEITTPDTGGQSRVLRGGSWLYSTDFARVGYRGGYDPVYRGLSWGFRVLSSVPIADR
ncbi:MAG: SUMF1/EgtB/PvdO family nonheme iron enzyme [bacterium]|nr:SUMF1/EgtB/PvdO family nonheme iron enzyme [bacterium]